MGRHEVQSLPVLPTAPLLALTQITSPTAGTYQLRGTLLSMQRVKLGAENITLASPDDTHCRSACKLPFLFSLTARAGSQVAGGLSRKLCCTRALLDYLLTTNNEFGRNPNSLFCHKIRPVSHLGLSGLFAFRV